MRLSGTSFWTRLLQQAAAASSSAKLLKPMSGAGSGGGADKSAPGVNDVNGTI